MGTSTASKSGIRADAIPEVDLKFEQDIATATALVRTFQLGSVGLLQRKMLVSHSKAVRLLNELTRRGVCGPPYSRPFRVFDRAVLHSSGIDHTHAR